MAKTRLIYTVEVDGKPIVTFEGQAREAAELCKEAWFRSDLSGLTSNGNPLCVASSIIKTRVANETEMAVYREAAGQVRPDEDMIFAYLVELDG